MSMISDLKFRFTCLIKFALKLEKFQNVMYHIKANDRPAY